MLFVPLRGGVVGIPPITCELTEHVPSSLEESDGQVYVDGRWQPYRCVAHRMTRTLTVAEVTKSHTIFDMAEVANAGRYYRGEIIGRSQQITLEELPAVRSASDVLLYIERKHPKARGRLNDCVSRVRFERFSVWRLDYGALDYEPGNTYDFVLPTGSSVGAFSLGPTGYMTVTWELLSLT